MTVYIYRNLFQKKMSMFFQDMMNVCVYIDVLLIIRNDHFENYMDILGEVPILLKNSRIQVNAVNMSGTMIPLVIYDMF